MNTKRFPIFITVSGLTPQIITESLYDFIVQKKLAIEEVHVITTLRGKERIRELLLANGRGALYNFCRDYDLEAEKYIPRIQILRDNNQNDLEDIRSITDNESAANFIVNFVREQASRKNTQILASIAGGRKTMGVYLAFAMQLFGRPFDQLFHVLVQPEIIENSPSFFYPPAKKKFITIQNSKQQKLRVKVNEIKIENTEIPFLRVSEILPSLGTDHKMDFPQMVKITQGIIDKNTVLPRLKIELKNKRITLYSKDYEYSWSLSPQEMTLYYYLGKYQQIVNDKDNQSSNADKLFEIFKRHFPYLGIKNGITIFANQDIREIRSRINKKIREAVRNPVLQQFILISTHPPRQCPTYTIAIPSSNIELI